MTTAAPRAVWTAVVLTVALTACDPGDIASSDTVVIHTAPSHAAGSMGAEVSPPAALRGTPLSPAEGPQPLTRWALESPYPVARERQPLVLYNEVVIDDPDWVLRELPTDWVDSMQVIKGVVAREIWGSPAASGAILVFASPPGS